jgi:hypothetical protein
MRQVKRFDLDYGSPMLTGSRTRLSHLQTTFEIACDLRHFISVPELKFLPLDCPASNGPQSRVVDHYCSTVFYDASGVAL